MGFTWLPAERVRGCLVCVQAGVANKRVALLLRDESITSEEALEDVNTLLNGGAVPQLFNADDTTAIVNDVGPRARAEGATTPAEIMAFFYTVVHKNLNIVLCFSPMAAKFR
jgi:hypothetical protein